MVSPLRVSNYPISKQHSVTNYRSCSGPYTPIPAATQATLKLIEGNVDVFVELHLPKHLTPARHRMAKFVGAGPDEIVTVFIPNTPHGTSCETRISSSRV
jgi:hypothetical protein